MKQGRCNRCERRFTWPEDTGRRRTFCPLCGRPLSACQVRVGETPMRLETAPTGPAWHRLHVAVGTA